MTISKFHRGQLVKEGGEKVKNILTGIEDVAAIKAEANLPQAVESLKARVLRNAEQARARQAGKKA